MVMEEAQFLESRALRAILSLVPEVRMLINPELLRAKANRIKTDQAYREQLAGVYQLLANTLKNATTLETFVSALSKLKEKVHQVYDDNLEKVAQQTLEVRKNLFALKGFYDNYQGKKARIIPVDRAQFVEAGDDSLLETNEGIDQQRIQSLGYEKMSLLRFLYLSFGNSCWCTEGSPLYGIYYGHCTTRHSSFQYGKFGQ